MNPESTLEFKPIGEPARLGGIMNPAPKYDGIDEPARSHGRRSFKRAWVRRMRRRSSAAAMTTHARHLSAGEESLLAERIKAGDVDAEQKLHTANLGLVFKAVSDYTQCGVAKDDLIQEGNLGLIRAARHFDPSTHTARFATYATYWIRCFMIRALSSNGSLIQRPESMRLLRLQYVRALHELRARGTAASGEAGSQSPSLDEIARYIGVSPERLKQVRLTRNEQSIRQNLGELMLVDGPAPDRDVVINEDRALVCAALRRLSPFEAWVICERFGLGDPPDRGMRLVASRNDLAHDIDGSATSSGPTDAVPAEGRRPTDSYFCRSYFDMGRDCGLSVFRLRQVEKTALDKLRGILAQRARTEI